jgi:geranylgeranylglycerol-phosphate geranylgeranyltransferase
MATLFFSAKCINGIRSIPAFAQLIRLPSSFLAGLAGWATCYALNPNLPIDRSLLTAGVLLCMTAAACTINDYWDVDKDRLNHPDRPLPSGQLSLKQAWWIATVLFGGAFVAAALLGFWPLILTIINIILLWYYSRLLTFSGILGNVIVATSICLLIVLSSLVSHRPFAMLYPIAFLFCYALLREIVLDIHDAEGDRSQGVVTIANSLGVSIAFQVTWGLLTILLISLPIATLQLSMQHPLWFGGLATVLLLSMAIPLALYQYQGSEQAYQRLIFWERLGMLLGGLGLLGAAPN